VIHRPPASRPRTLVLFVAGCAALWLYVGLVLLDVVQNVALLPVWVTLGSVTVPGAILIILGGWERHADLASGALLRAAIAGGGIAFVAGGTVDAVARATFGDQWAAFAAAPAEEACKLAVVIAIAARFQRTCVAQGLLLGAVVGLGFAAFENMGYAMAPFLDQPFDPALLQSASEQAARQLLTPLGHPLWTALISAGVFAGARRLGARSLAVVVFVAVAAVHGLWDAAFSHTLDPELITAAHLALWPLTLVQLAAVWLVAWRCRPTGR
jgi:RsiW-degrading membrane proteinase PrsW (M82 family)